MNNPYLSTLIHIPDRDPNAMSGSEFANSIMNMPANQQREDAIYDQLVMGNIPEFLRNAVAVSSTVNGNNISYLVFPDVLCIGNDNDFLRIPLQAPTARKIADAWNCSMITKRISDQIWHAGTLKCPVIGWPGPYTNVAMAATSCYVWHNNQINNKINGQSFELLVGHFKDVLYSKALLTNTHCVSIYGFSGTSGIPIQGPQPNSSSHDERYVDYSQKIRLICRQVEVNGQAMDIYDVLRDSTICSLISDEGPYDASSIYK